MRLLLATVLTLAAAHAQPGRVAAISHRGEHLRHPENTMPAYRAALEAGADFIETDVRTTADGRLVIMHDGSVDRTTGGHGEVAGMTFAEIRKLDAGAKFAPAFRGTAVPTFEEVLEFARGRIGVYIDAKRISARDLVGAVGKFGMEEQVVVYGGLELLREVAKLAPRIKVMPEAVSVGVVTRLVEELRPRVIAFDARDFQDPVIAAARGAGADVYVDRLGPADTPDSWEDAIRRGATGIQSDRPAELVEFLRGKRLHREGSAFEVASIKAVEELRGRLFDFSSSGPRVRYIGYSAVNLIMEAHNLKAYQVTFAPNVEAPAGGVYGVAIYDIEAKAEGEQARPRNDFRPMLQTLLADRFHLKTHRAMKEMPVYALVVGKSGPNLKASAPDAAESARIGVNGRNQTVTASRKSMDELAGMLENVFFLDRPVLDRTGLSGVYDFTLEATPQSRMTADDPELKNISVFTAVQQLGLRLDSQKAMVEVLVVDHIEKPSAN